MNKLTRKQLADQIGCEKRHINTAIAEIKQQSNVLDEHIETIGKANYLDDTAVALITDYITKRFFSPNKDKSREVLLSLLETYTQKSKDEETHETQSETDVIEKATIEDSSVKTLSSTDKTEVASALPSTEVNVYKLLWEAEKQNRQNDLKMFQDSLERSYEQVEHLKQQLSQQHKIFEMTQEQMDAERQQFQEQLDVKRQQFQEQLDIERQQTQRLTREKENAIAALIIARETLSKISSAGLLTNKKALAAQCLALPAPSINN